MRLVTFTLQYNPMKYFLLLLLTVAAVTLQAQTKVIAHKSHSGTKLSFSTAGSDNFGLDMSHYRWRKTTVQVTKLNDTLFLFKNKIEHLMAFGDKDSFQLDTVYSHQFIENPNLSVDSVLRFYPEVELIGFDKDQLPVFDTLSSHKKQVLPVGTALPPNGGSGNGPLFIVLAALCAAAIAFGSWKQYHHTLTA